MQLRNKYFSYPVLSDDNYAYVNSKFETESDVALDGYNIKLTLNSILQNKELEELLELGKAKIIHHIECPGTCFREIVETDKMECKYAVRDSSVDGLVQICSFLVAVEAIDGYQSSDFSKDYIGFKFNIERGCILAIGSQQDLIINKIRDDLANTESIISIIPIIDDPIKTELDVELGNEKIIIRMPEKTYNMYGNMSAMIDIQPIMHSMIIVPALMKTFSELRAAKDELFNYEKRRWFRGLKKACEKLGYSLDKEGLESIDEFTASQKLLDSPITRAVEYFGISGEDKFEKE